MPICEHSISVWPVCIYLSESWISQNNMSWHGHRHSNSGPLFPHLVPPAIMVWIFVWNYSRNTSCEPNLNHLSISYNISCYNSLVLLTFVSRSSCPITYICIKVWKIVKIQRGNPRFYSIFYNNAPVLKRTFACPRLKNDFPSFLSSLYVRTTNIYWRNSSLFSTTHPTFLHSCPFRRSDEHILFRAISLVGKIFGTFLACSSLRTATPCIERPIK